MNTTTLHEIQSLKAEIEELKRQLEDKEIVFNNILESTLAGYWDWYIQDNYEYLSPTFKSMFGYTDAELPNSPETWQKIIHPDDLPGVFEIYEKHVKSKGKHPYDNVVRYFHKNGSIVWVYCRGNVIEWDENGDPIRMVGCHVDITHENEIQAKLEKREIELKAKNKELEQFAYVASHDLQEPINTIASCTELLGDELRDDLDEDLSMAMKHVLNATSRMKQLIKALLEFSRLGYERKLETADCKKIVNDIVLDLGASIKETQATVNIGKLPTLSIYPTEFRQLVQNLIFNGIKFHKPGTLPVLNIESKETNEFWEFSVTDNGIGIKDNHQERVFGIFQRLHSRHEYDGTGIGLAHCRKIVEIHGGEIWVESTTNKGSTFYFTIPKKTYA